MTPRVSLVPTVSHRGLLLRHLELSGYAVRSRGRATVLALLQTLEEFPGAAIGVLVERAGYSRWTLQRWLRRLIECGLVEREQHGPAPWTTGPAPYVYRLRERA